MIRAIYGGTFDPFHNGHAAIASIILERHFADILHLVPAGQAPGKPVPRVAGADRLRMSEAAVAGLDGALRERIIVESLEIRRRGATYTIDTLESLVARHPGDDWRLVVGADAMAGFDHWRRPRDILALAGLIVFAREGSTDPTPASVAGRVQRIEDFAMPVSSTELRARLEAGTDVRRDLPAGVIEFIKDNGLYSSRTGA